MGSGVGGVKSEHLQRTHVCPRSVRGVLLVGCLLVVDRSSPQLHGTLMLASVLPVRWRSYSYGLPGFVLLVCSSD